MRPRRCCVPGCSHKMGKKYAIPTDPIVRAVWISRISNAKVPLGKDAKFYSAYRICETHFADICKQDSARLKKYSLPTLNLPGYIEHGTEVQNSFCFPHDAGAYSTPQIIKKALQQFELAEARPSSFAASDGPELTVKIPAKMYRAPNKRPDISFKPSYNITEPSDEVFEDPTELQLTDNYEISQNLNLLNFNVSENFGAVDLEVDNTSRETEISSEKLCFANTSEVNSSDVEDLKPVIYNSKEAELEVQKPYFKSLKTFLQEPNCMIDVCRICFTSLINTEEAIKLYEESSEHNTAEIKNRFKFVLPDLDLELYSNNVICVKCYELLQSSYELKAKWLLAEEKLRRIIEEQTNIRRDADLVIIATKEKIPKTEPVAIEDHDYTNTVLRECNNMTNVTKRKKWFSVEKNSCGPPIRKKRIYSTAKVDIRRGYLCEKCGATFVYRCSLKKHSVKHSLSKDKPKNMMCETCGQLFFDKTTLRLHYRKHKEFKCSFCDLIFKQKRELDVHVKFRHIKKSYQCHICGKLFNSTSAFSSHKRIHNSLKKIYSCKICDKKFFYSSSVRNHTRTHVAALLKCEYCGKNLKYQVTLQKHIKMYHLGEARHVCKFCNKIYWEKRGLVKHYIRIHNTYPSKEEPPSEVPAKC